MPGHIYAQSDKIQEAISAFSAAAANELNWIESDSLYPTGHHGHNVHFLIHALNLGGRYDDSMKWVQHLFTFKENPRERAGNNQRGVWRQGYFGLIKTSVRFEKWNEILDGKTLPVYDKPEQQAWRHWAMGLAYSATGPERQGEGDARRDAEGSRRGHVGEGADRHRAAGARGDDRGARRRSQERLRAVPQGGGSRSGDDVHRAARPIRGRSSKGWANVALALGDYATAEKAYRETLAREPGSGRAYFGLAAALDGLGQDHRGAATRGRAPPRRGRTRTPTCRRCRSCARARRRGQQ